jgi:hypothetical protein
VLHRTARPRIRRLHCLEQRQDVLHAVSRPQSEKSVMGVFQRAPATDGDESGVSLLWEDHRSTSSFRPPDVTGLDTNTGHRRTPDSRMGK